MVVIAMSEPESRSQLDGAHCPDGDDLPKGRGIYHSVDAAEARRIKNIGELGAKLERPGVAQGHYFREGHIKQNLSRTFDAVAPGIAETTGGRSNECAGIEPLKDCRIGGSNGFAGHICTRCAVGAPTDVSEVA